MAKKKNKNQSGIEFSKYTGAGNDFIIIDNRTQGLSKIYKKKLVKQVCDRNFGVGADGAIFLEKKQGVDFGWDFYNQDGSPAEMCINAARCVTLFEQTRTKKKKISFLTAIGILEGLADKRLITVKVPQNISCAQKKEVQVITSADEFVVSGYFINTGVPHFVVERVNIKDDPEVYAYLRFHPDFGGSGANITVWQYKKEKLNASTYERGVEGFTLACGTGAAATAAVVNKLKGLSKNKVCMPGGEITIQILKDYYLATGPAVKICDGFYAFKNKS